MSEKTIVDSEIERLKSLIENNEGIPENFSDNHEDRILQKISNNYEKEIESIKDTGEYKKEIEQNQSDYDSLSYVEKLTIHFKDFWNWLVIFLLGLPLGWIISWFSDYLIGFSSGLIIIILYSIFSMEPKKGKLGEKIEELERFKNKAEELIKLYNKKLEENINKQKQQLEKVFAIENPIDYFIENAEKNEIQEYIYFSDKIHWSKRKYRDFEMDYKKLQNAIDTYATELNQEDIIVLFDNTFFGKGDNGFIMTNAYFHLPDVRIPIALVEKIEVTILGELKFYSAKGGNDIVSSQINKKNLLKVTDLLTNLIPICIRKLPYAHYASDKIKHNARAEKQAEQQDKQKILNEIKYLNSMIATKKSLISNFKKTGDFTGAEESHLLKLEAELSNLNSKLLAMR